MSILARPVIRWSALVGLWGVVLAVLWILAVQLFLLALNPFCHLQQPGLAHLEVVSVDRNPDSQITDFVTAKHGNQVRVLALAKEEAAELRPEDEVWILDAWYTDGLRPTQFRLTLLRLLLEYPAILLLPVAWGLWRVRRAREAAEAAPLPPVRRTFTDDFHTRAQRFAKPTMAADAGGAKDEDHPPPMNTDERRPKTDEG